MSKVNAQEVKMDENSRELSEVSRLAVQLPPKPRPSSLREDGGGVEDCLVGQGRAKRENTLKVPLFPSFTPVEYMQKRARVVCHLLKEICTSVV